MLQEILALIVIFIFLVRLGFQLYHEQIPRSQFILWLVFWLIGGVVVIYLQDIDRLVARLGFSSSGIEVLLYLTVAVMFYLILRLRLKLERMERDITTLTRHLARTTHSSKDHH